MKKIIFILLLVFILTSCGQTQQEKLQKQKECKELWLEWWINWFDDIVCGSYRKNPVMDCIKEYTNWLDEKYNNPDIVSNLREDDYSKVVETCNKIFGNK